MEHDHTFSPKHGFTGSAHVTKEHRPSIPGFTRGQNIGGGAPMAGGMDDEAAEAGNMKHGGLAHIKSHHKNYAHGGRIEHDGHPKHKHPGYDKHGFEKSHGRKKHHGE